MDKSLYERINNRLVPFNFKGTTYRGFLLKKNLIKIRMFVDCSKNKDLFNIDCLYKNRACLVDFICTDFKLHSCNLTGSLDGWGDELTVEIKDNRYKFFVEKPWGPVSFTMDIECNDPIWKPYLIMREDSCWGNEEDCMSMLEREDFDCWEDDEDE